MWAALSRGRGKDTEAVGPKGPMRTCSGADHAAAALVTVRPWSLSGLLLQVAMPWGTPRGGAGQRRRWRKSSSVFGIYSSIVDASIKRQSLGRPESLPDGYGRGTRSCWTCWAPAGPAVYDIRGRGTPSHHLDGMGTIQHVRPSSATGTFMEPSD